MHGTAVCKLRVRHNKWAAAKPVRGWLPCKYSDTFFIVREKGSLTRSEYRNKMDSTKHESVEKPCQDCTVQKLKLQPFTLEIVVQIFLYILSKMSLK